MIFEDYRKEMNRILAFYGKEFDGTQIQAWFDLLKHLSASAFRAAVAATLMAERYFPTPKVILNYAAEHIENSEEAQKKRFPSWKQVAKLKSTDSEYLKQAKELFGKAASGKLIGGDLADAMFEMESKWPNKGWFEQACEVLKRSNDMIGIKTAPEFMPKIPQNEIKVSNCAFHECRNTGTLSPFTGETKDWYCREHWGL